MRPDVSASQPWTSTSALASRRAIASRSTGGAIWMWGLPPILRMSAPRLRTLTDQGQADRTASPRRGGCGDHQTPALLRGQATHAQQQGRARLKPAAGEQTSSQTLVAVFGGKAAGLHPDRHRARARQAAGDHAGR